MKKNKTTFQITVVDMYDYGKSYQKPSVTNLREALSIAEKTVLNSVKWGSKECGYSQWMSFGEDVVISSSDSKKKINFSGMRVIRERCKCDSCKAYIEEN